MTGPDKQGDVFCEKSPCPYFDDARGSTVEFFIPRQEDARHFDTYLAKGYRRIGRAFYRNLCSNCSECLPLRLATETFQLSRSQKRTLKKNADIAVRLLGRPSLTPEKTELYSAYVHSKHGGCDDADVSNPVNVLLNMHYGYPWTLELNYYLEDRLIAVGIVDEGQDALSSNYFYYDTSHLERRLGIFSILTEIELAKSLGKKYYYLGFCIEANRKMSYKKFFRPNEILQQGQWKPYCT
jgi:arginine-tRNA-protein transferase